MERLQTSCTIHVIRGHDKGERKNVHKSENKFEGVKVRIKDVPLFRTLHFPLIGQSVRFPDTEM